MIDQPFRPTHRHYKGGLYEKVGDARHSETEEALVVYRTPNGDLWVRPAAMFYELLADGRPRFATLSP